MGIGKNPPERTNGLPGRLLAYLVLSACVVGLQNSGAGPAASVGAFAKTSYDTAPPAGSRQLAQRHPRHDPQQNEQTRAQ